MAGIAYKTKKVVKPKSRSEEKTSTRLMP